MTVKMKDTDKGFKAIQKQAKKLKLKSFVRVGVTQKQGANPHDTEPGSTVAEIATFHEFGLGVPRRPFVSQPVDNNRSTYFKILEASKIEIVTGKMSVDKSLGLLGQRIAADMRDAITEKDYQQLSPLVIAQRLAQFGDADPTPLVDTGQLLNSITYEVVL